MSQNLEHFLNKQNKKYLRFFPPIFYISKYSNWLVGSGNKQVTTIPKDLHTCSSPIISILLLGNRRTTLFAVEPDSQTGKHLSFPVSSLLWCTLKKVFSIGLSREYCRLSLWPQYRFPINWWVSLYILSEDFHHDLVYNSTGTVPSGISFPPRRIPYVCI